MFYLLTTTNTVIKTLNCGLTPAICVFIRIHIASICGLHTQTQATRQYFLIDNKVCQMQFIMNLHMLSHARVFEINTFRLELWCLD